MTKENELTPFTFKDSKKTVLTRRVSPLLMLELRSNIPQPEPPLQEVKYGEDIVLEPNEAHPDYVRALYKYNEELKDKAMRLLIRRGIVLNWTDEMRAEVQELRDFWKEEFQKELSGPDDLIYVQYVCIGSPQDLDDFTNFITTRSQPTEAVIAEAQKFPGS